MPAASWVRTHGSQESPHDLTPHGAITHPDTPRPPCPHSGPQLPDAGLRDGPERRAVPGQWVLWLRAEAPLSAQPPWRGAPPPGTARQGEDTPLPPAPTPRRVPPPSLLGDTP